MRWHLTFCKAEEEPEPEPVPEPLQDFFASVDDWIPDIPEEAPISDASLEVAKMGHVHGFRRGESEHSKNRGMRIQYEADIEEHSTKKKVRVRVGTIDELDVDGDGTLTTDDFNSVVSPEQEPIATRHESKAAS